jgi:hypothetical protein
MPDHTTTSAALYLKERGYTVKSKRDGTELPPSSGTVKQWCERGKIKARKAGWVWLIAEEDLAVLVDNAGRQISDNG